MPEIPPTGGLALSFRPRRGISVVLVGVTRWHPARSFTRWKSLPPLPEVAPLDWRQQ